MWLNVPAMGDYLLGIWYFLGMCLLRLLEVAAVVCVILSGVAFAMGNTALCGSLLVGSGALILLRVAAALLYQFVFWWITHDDFENEDPTGPTQAESAESEE